mgnify:CR=1 FL=1
MTDERLAAPVERPTVLTVAGSDSGGGAGVQADLKTIEALGAFGTSAITSVTAQHTRGVTSTHPVPVDEVRAQIEAVGSNFDVRAVKTGMLGTASVAEVVADHAADWTAPVVVDPVMVAASGDRLLTRAGEDAYEELVAEATVVTPNAAEAAALTGVDVRDAATMREAGRELVDLGADWALVTGGHVETDDGTVRDVLVGRDDVVTVDGPRVDTAATHGSGCALSSAIAARLARRDDPVDAVGFAVGVVERMIRYPLAVGEGPGAVHHLAPLRDRAARQPTRAAVERIVERLVAADARALIPEVGTNVAGATPHAEAVDETVAVEGRLVRIDSGVRSVRGTRFGASSHVARFLLAARERDPALRFAANVRFDERIESPLDALDAPAIEIDRREEPSPDEEGSTMGWAAERAFDAATGTPAAVYDRGAVGKEAMVRLVAADEETLTDRLLTLLDAC